MKRNNVIRYLLLLIITVIGIYFTSNRNMQHFLCAIVIPQIFIETKKIKLFDFLQNGYLIYFIWCIIWEFHQFLNNGFLQFDQLTFDILGIVVSYIIFSNINRLR